MLLTVEKKAKGRSDIVIDCANKGSNPKRRGYWFNYRVVRQLYLNR